MKTSKIKGLIPAIMAGALLLGTFTMGGCSSKKAADVLLKLTILQTTDLHHHASGYGSFREYTPLDTGDNDKVKGGYARLATMIGKIRQEEAAKGNSVLLVDSGDFTMGTIYDFTATNPLALKFFQLLKYDAITLGNHEFDWAPAGLAMLIGQAGASTEGFTVPIIASNTVTSTSSTADDNLEALFTSGAIVKKKILTLSNGLKVGLLGYLGKRAKDSAPTAPPVTFNHDYPFLQSLVDEVKNTDKVDLVVLISHGGIESNGTGDDADLATNVNDIDVIAAGHYHTATTQTHKVNGALIFEAGSYGKYLGRLDLTYNQTQGKVESHSFQLLPVDDSVAGDAAIQGMIATYNASIDQAVAASLNGAVTTTSVAELSFDLESKSFAESGLGNLCADAIRNIASMVALAKVQAVGGNTVDAVYHLAAVPDGVVRDGLYKGNNGIASLADIYNVLPLGMSPDPANQKVLGWPLVTVYLTPQEIKMVGEVAVTVSHLAGNSDYWLSLSGVRMVYDPNAYALSRVQKIYLCGNTLPTAVGGDNDTFSTTCTTELNLFDSTTRYRAVVDLYTLMSLGLVKNYGLPITPKHANGTPIDMTSSLDFMTTRIDIDPLTAGIQELKEWTALYKFVSAFPDTGGVAGVPEIPTVYNTGGVALGRLKTQ